MELAPPVIAGRGDFADVGRGRFCETQVVDGNYGIHAVIRKVIFTAGDEV
jgi:hypothetical protein